MGMTAYSVEIKEIVGDIFLLWEKSEGYVENGYKAETIEIRNQWFGDTDDRPGSLTPPQASLTIDRQGSVMWSTYFGYFVDGEFQRNDLKVYPLVGSPRKTTLLAVREHLWLTVQGMFVHEICEEERKAEEQRQQNDAARRLESWLRVRKGKGRLVYTSVSPSADPPLVVVTSD